MRAVESVWGAIVEAWQEVRIHRVRVLLSLIGVAVAVCALSSVVGLANIAQQGLTESNERFGGRPALLSVSASYGPDGTPLVGGGLPQAWAGVVERHKIEYTSSVRPFGMRVQFRGGVAEVNTTAVDQPYAAMHRLRISEGSWFAKSDTERLAPALVVNGDFWRKLGSPSLASHPTARVLSGDGEVTAVVVGVFRTPAGEDMTPSAYVLTPASAPLMSVDYTGGAPANLEAWVPPHLADPLAQAIREELDQSLGAGTASVNRQDYLAHGDDPLGFLKLAVGGIAVLVLLLGALGLVNIALVTVRHRIREIGVRRSFGATAGRVFFAVMMESVVATMVAGAAGVGLSILIVKSPWLEQLIGRGMVSDLPPFPVEAAVIGMVAATAVGALAGLLPALVAVRVKVIDAIRY
ncbi:ABC transporter permease [Leifsonia sp. NCR5]|uniref:ABC transporter permease n=1 Tax=Leifsonia sp. NCR5 TaxID=1978342 RepID=UPI000A197D2A|nr:ABC transporter permease [Leifsonia sp. NCR5]